MKFASIQFLHEDSSHFVSLRKRLSVVVLLCAFVCLPLHTARAAASQLWTHSATAGSIKWYTLTDAGTLLIGTETSVYSLNPDNGQVSWRRDDLKGIAEHETQEVLGTPLLLISDNTGAVMKKTRLFALDLLTGETIWQTEKLRGTTVQATPNYEKDMLIFLTVQSNAMTAITVASAAMSKSSANYNFSRGNDSAGWGANKNFVNTMGSYEQFMTKRYSATKTSGNYTYVLTDVKLDKENGAGLVGVNMNTGQGDRQIMFKDKEPDYQVDELTGRVFNLKGNNHVAFTIE